MPPRHAHIMPTASPHAPATDSVTLYPCPHAAHTWAPAPWTPTDASPLSEDAQCLMPPHIPRWCPRAALTHTAHPPYMPPGPPYVPPTVRRPTCRPPSLSATRPPSHVRLFDLGILTATAKLSDVNNKLTVTAFCRQRLAVIMCMARLAETVSAVHARCSSLCSPSSRPLHLSSRPMGDVSHRPRQRGMECMRMAQGHGHWPRVGCGGSVQMHGIVGMQL